MNVNIRFTSALLNVIRLHFYSTHRAFLLAFCLALMLPVNANASPGDSQAMMNLVPLAQMDRVVVKSGRWSQPSTWSGGQLPQAGENIHVPAGMRLVVNVVDHTSINTLRVDGILKFPSRRNVSIKVDTLIVTDQGKFILGTKKNPIQAGKTVEIIIADNGPIDRQWDPENMSRGIILHGKTRIFGTEKTPYHPLSIHPGLGETHIQLSEDPIGWKVGDKIVITATRFRKKQSADTSYVTYDELRRIASINGRDITLGDINDAQVPDPLNYDHVPSNSSMPVYAANLTRNIIFKGEGGDFIPAAERGHFMIIHNSDAIVKGAGFYHLGRTDKSRPIDDFELDANGRRVRDSQGNYIPGPKNNPRGRYAMHFHHTGVADSSSKPAICSGNAVISSPGWGFVIHGSQVDMNNNASFDVYGSHFVSEDGNELGSLEHNIAIRAEGWNSQPKARMLNHDLGHSGHGFWLEGRNLKVEDNVVSGAYRAGLVYFHRHDPNLSGVDLEIPAHNLLTHHKEIVKGRATIAYDNVPITHQKNMTVLASGKLLTVIKANGNQGHNVRSRLESLKGYAVMNGLDIQYTQKYTFKDLVIVADQATGSWDEGVLMNTSTRNMAIVNAQIDGFRHPIVEKTFFQNQPDRTDALFVNVSVNGQPLNPQTDIHTTEGFPGITSAYDPAFHQIIDTVDLTPGRLDFNFSSGLSFTLPQQILWNTKFEVTGTTDDSAGAKPYSSVWNDHMLKPILAKGYYTRADGSKFVILNGLVADRVTRDTIPLDVEADIIYNYGSLLGPNLGTAP